MNDFETKGDRRKKKQLTSQQKWVKHKVLGFNGGLGLKKKKRLLKKKNKM